MPERRPQRSSPRSVFASSVVSVETAFPVFIGYTHRARQQQEDDLRNIPWRISSMPEYELYFGFAPPETGLQVTIDATQPGLIEVQGSLNAQAQTHFLMYHSLQMFFINGGGPCYIVSVGDYQTSGGVIEEADLRAGLQVVETVNEVTLILFPDAMKLATGSSYYALHQAAMSQCVKLRDRFVVLDVYRPASNQDHWQADIDFLRDTLSGTTTELQYAAAYFPQIYTQLRYSYTHPDTGQMLEESVAIIGLGIDVGINLAEVKEINYALYLRAKQAISEVDMLLPAAPAVVGIYAQVDKARGVWKAPANVNISFAARPELLINDVNQENLNVDLVTGKSISAIRSLAGRGPAIVWGARTLAGNDNQWRYVSVRRFCIMVEKSIKNATEQLVFEPNEPSTWRRVKTMVEGYLDQLWKAGALMGVTNREAYLAKVGLGETMTALDVEQGRMIIEIGVAVVRPYEFVILRITQKMTST